MILNTGKLSIVNGFDEDERVLKSEILKNQNVGETLPPPPPPPKKNYPDSKEKPGPTAVRKEEEDIFVGDGIDYSIPSKDMSQSPISEDMEESPRNKERTSYFNEPAYGPAPTTEPSHGWQQVVSVIWVLALEGNTSMIPCMTWKFLILETFFTLLPVATDA